MTASEHGIGVMPIVEVVCIDIPHTVQSPPRGEVRRYLCCGREFSRPMGAWEGLAEVVEVVCLADKEMEACAEC